MAPIVIDHININSFPILDVLMITGVGFISGNGSMSFVMKDALVVKDIMPAIRPKTNPIQNSFLEIFLIFTSFFMGSTRFEPMTNGLKARRSTLLSYEPIQKIKKYREGLILSHQKHKALKHSKT